MRSCAAVCVHDDLASRQARVAIGAADEELARGVDVPHGVFCDPALRQSLQHVGFDHLANLHRGHVLDGVLMRHNDLAHADRLAVLVPYSDLTLGIRAESLLGARMTRVSKQLQNFVRIVQWRRHELGRFTASITKNDALIARALILVAAGVDALGKIS